MDKIKYFVNKFEQDDGPSKQAVKQPVKYKSSAASLTRRSSKSISSLCSNFGDDAVKKPRPLSQPNLDIQLKQKDKELQHARSAVNIDQQEKDKPNGPIEKSKSENSVNGSYNDHHVTSIDSSNNGKHASPKRYNKVVKKSENGEDKSNSGSDEKEEELEGVSVMKLKKMPPKVNNNHSTNVNDNKLPLRCNEYSSSENDLHDSASHLNKQQLVQSVDEESDSISIAESCDSKWTEQDNLSVSLCSETLTEVTDDGEDFEEGLDFAEGMSLSSNDTSSEGIDVSDISLSDEKKAIYSEKVAKIDDEIIELSENQAKLVEKVHEITDKETQFAQKMSAVAERLAEFTEKVKESASKAHDTNMNRSRRGSSSRQSLSGKSTTDSSKDNKGDESEFYNECLTAQEDIKITSYTEHSVLEVEDIKMDSLKDETYEFVDENENSVTDNVFKIETNDNEQENDKHDVKSETSVAGKEKCEETKTVSTKTGDQFNDYRDKEGGIKTKKKKVPTATLR